MYPENNKICNIGANNNVISLGTFMGLTILANYHRTDRKLSLNHYYKIDI